VSLSRIQTTAHEGDTITTAPGWFGPTCNKHETLRNNANTFDVQIRDGGQTYTMFDVIQNWISSDTPSGVIPSSSDETSCP
jgi:hypothetical protein